MATKTEMQQAAAEIRDETTNEANTATRVGSHMLDVVNSLGTVWRYTFDGGSQADANPGANTFRLNNASQAAATFLYVNEVPHSGMNILELLKLLAADDFVVLAQTGDDSRSEMYRVTGAITEATGYVKIPIETKGSGAALQGNAEVSLQFITKGGADAAGDTTDGLQAAAAGQAPGTYLHADDLGDVGATIGTWTSRHGYNSVAEGTINVERGYRGKKVARLLNSMNGSGLTIHALAADQSGNADDTFMAVLAVDNAALNFAATGEKPYFAFTNSADSDSLFTLRGNTSIAPSIEFYLEQDDGTGDTLTDGTLFLRELQTGPAVIGFVAKGTSVYCIVKSARGTIAIMTDTYSLSGALTLDEFRIGADGFFTSELKLRAFAAWAKPTSVSDEILHAVVDRMSEICPVPSLVMEHMYTPPSAQSFVPQSFVSAMNYLEQSTYVEATLGPDPEVIGILSTGGDWPGLAWNFSTDDALVLDTLARAADLDTDQQMTFAIAIRGDNWTGDSVLMAYSHSGNDNSDKSFYINSSGFLVMRTQVSEGNDENEAVGDVALSIDVNYIIVFHYDGAQCNAWALSGDGVWTQIMTNVPMGEPAGGTWELDRFQIGARRGLSGVSDTFDGAIRAWWIDTFANAFTAADARRLANFFNEGPAQIAPVGSLSGMVYGSIEWVSGTQGIAHTNGVYEPLDGMTTALGSPSNQMSQPSNGVLRNDGPAGYFDIFAFVDVDPDAIGGDMGVRITVNDVGIVPATAYRTWVTTDHSDLTMYIRTPTPVWVGANEDIELYAGSSDSPGVTYARLHLSARRVST